ncbi:cellulase family glycosylhydrolase [Azospirillum canadense]|uniref:cellulase family glycosylhydrolase n=1 Tax=Azospirillum canadense TaxID=403962 RepID=UPI0022271974|nr:carbohydrate-binding domain-containing protein [Azospirillum canadense]MCW2244376.1 endoglucanase [Azospirillum canadense]
MATTTTSLVDTTFVVNASGQAAGGIWPQLKLRLDGVDIGQATVSSTSTGRYTFTAKVAPDQAHKVQIVYDNDGFVNGQDRNLIVKSLEVNGKTVNSTNSLVTYDKGALDGADVVPGQEGMWWDGALNFALTKDYFPVTTPTAPAGNAQIVLNVQGNAAGGTNAHFNLLIDGKKVGEGTAGATAKDFAFATNVTQDQAHKIQIQYDNDATVNGVDRNLMVNKITINGHAVNPTDSNVTYDKGALDGQDVVKGQSGMWWNGTLQVAADKSWFPGSTTTPTTPTTPTSPTPTKPSITVSDVSVTEPTGSTTTNGIASGPLHTQGGQIIDSAGHAVKLTGVNWFGAEGYAFVPQGLWLDSYQHHMDNMKSLGFNTIRLPWSDAMLDGGGRMPTGIDYNLNPDLKGLNSLQVFDKIIQYADKTGMKIILDHHRSDDGASANENGLWYTSSHPESTMIANWKMLAARYANNPSVVAADLHNEPHGQATWGSGNQSTDWAAAAERIGNAIQSVNNKWLMIVEGVEQYNGNTYWWGGNLDGEKVREVNFNTPDKLVYSVHDYPPSMAGFGWFNDSSYPNNMAAKWTSAWGRLIQNDQHPVLVGEFGTRLDQYKDQQWLPKLVQYMDGDWNTDGKIDLAAGKEGASWTYWAWSPGSGDTGGILNDDYSVNWNKVNILKPAMYSGSSSAPTTADAVFTVKLSQAYSQAVTVDYATADGTAKAGSDYTAASGKLTFAAGETSKTVTVKVLSDTVTEGSETFNLKLSNATQATIADATGVGTINPPGTAQALSADVDVLNHTVTQQATATVQSVDVVPASSQTQAASDLAHLATLTDHIDHTVSPYAHFMTDGA